MEALVAGESAAEDALGEDDACGQAACQVREGVSQAQEPGGAGRVQGDAALRRFQVQSRQQEVVGELDGFKEGKPPDLFFHARKTRAGVAENGVAAVFGRLAQRTLQFQDLQAGLVGEPLGFKGLAAAKFVHVVRDAYRESGPFEQLLRDCGQGGQTVFTGVAHGPRGAGRQIHDHVPTGAGARFSAKRFCPSGQAFLPEGQSVAAQSRQDSAHGFHFLVPEGQMHKVGRAQYATHKGRGGREMRGHLARRRARNGSGRIVAQVPYEVLEDTRAYLNRSASNSAESFKNGFSFFGNDESLFGNNRSMLTSRRFVFNKYNFWSNFRLSLSRYEA